MGEKGPLSWDVTLTREKFEDLINDLVERTIDPIKAALSDADLNNNQVDTILLVGGSTRVPLVQRVVKRILAKTPVRDISPEEVVALGAAVQSLVLAPLEGDIEDSLATRYGKEKPVIIHMTPFSLGVGLQSDQFAPLIERNSTYPTEAKDIFTTTRDFQEAISFPIYEGEEQIASENTFLDLLRIEGITPAPRGVPRIEVTFRLNADRILEARAEDLATGTEKVITIASTGSRLSDSEKSRMVKEARERVTKTLRERIQSNTKDEAGQIISRAQNLLESIPDHPRANEINQLIETVQRHMESGDESELGDISENLMRVVNEIESAST